MSFSWNPDFNEADINQARTLANIARRAETLFADGYECELWQNNRQHTDPAGTVHTYDLYFVTSPKGDVYMISLTDTPTDPVWGDECNCPAFAKFHECKHHLAVVKHAKEAAEAEALDNLPNPDETDDDQYPEY